MGAHRGKQTIFVTAAWEIKDVLVSKVLEELKEQAEKGEVTWR